MQNALIKKKDCTEALLVFPKMFQLACKNAEIITSTMAQTDMKQTLYGSNEKGNAPRKRCIESNKIGEIKRLGEQLRRRFH